VNLDRELTRTIDVFYDDANIRDAQRVAELIFEQVSKNSTTAKSDQ
jgi:hypothetical protein